MRSRSLGDLMPHEQMIKGDTQRSLHYLLAANMPHISNTGKVADISTWQFGPGTESHVSPHFRVTTQREELGRNLSNRFQMKPTASISDAQDDCNISGEISDDANMINTAREKMISVCVVKKTTGNKQQHLKVPAQPHRLDSSNSPAASSTGRLPNIKISYVDGNRQSSPELFDQYSNFPKEVANIIASQNFKIENMRYMLLNQEAKCRVMETEMVAMQQNHDQVVSQLNSQITVMMEALSMLLAPNEDEPRLYQNTRQGHAGEMK